MDLSKYPLENLLYFVAGIIPGFVALLIYQVASPGAFAFFFSMGYLGYKTKLAVALLVAFVVGNTMTRFLGVVVNSIEGGIGGYVGGRPYKPSHTVSGAPWRDHRWRTALKRHLGSDAPKDTILMSEALYDMKAKAIDLQPSPLRAQALSALNREKLQLEIDDGQWPRWYEHFHGIVLRPPEGDFFWYMQSDASGPACCAAIPMNMSQKGMNKCNLFLERRSE